MPLAAQREYGFIGGQEKCVAAAARKKLDAGVGLPMISLEAQRQLAIAIGELRAQRGFGLGQFALYFWKQWLSDCRRGLRQRYCVEQGRNQKDIPKRPHGAPL